MHNASDYGFSIAGQLPGATPSTPVAPYKVDTFAGGHEGSVSRQWMARPSDQRFNDLREMHDFKKGIFENSWEHVSPTKKGWELVSPEVQEASDLSKLSIAIPGVWKPGAERSEDVVVSPTHHSFTQLCALVKAPGPYLRTLPSQYVSQCLNYGFRSGARDVDSVMLFGDAASLKASTSTSYGRIPDHDVIAALMNIAGNGVGDSGHHWKTPGQLNWSNGTYDPENIGDRHQRTFYASDRDMFVFLVDDRRPIVVGKTKNGDDDLMFRGFYIQNSEVGTRSLAIKSFYLRGVCMNRNLWGCEGFEEIRINHTKMAPTRWLEQCVPALEAFSAGSDRKLIESVEKAKAAVIANDQDELVAFLKAKNFTKAQQDKIIDVHNVEEGKPIRSAWDVAQGITAMARSAINNDDRLEIEHVAKRILDGVVVA